MELGLPKHLGLLKLPKEVRLLPPQEIAVYLLAVELKNRRFMEQLETLGFDVAYYAFDFGSLILRLCGFEGRDDDTYDWYQKRLDHFVQQVTLKQDEQALNDIAWGFFSEIDRKCKEQKK